MTKQIKPERKVREMTTGKQNSWITFFRNPWKIAFIILLGIIIGLALLVGYRISTPRIEKGTFPTVQANSNDPILEVAMKKEQVNRVINYYTKDFFSASEGDYSFYLDQDALIEGTFSLLGHDTHFYLSFAPYVLTDGNIQLQAKDLSVGTLSVPIPAMINYISHTADFPEWVEIKADEQIIVLHLDKLVLDNGMSIKATKLNLIDDDIRFQLFLDTKDVKKNSKGE